MWWTYRAGSPFTAKYPVLGQHTFYRGLGTGEQGLWVIPDAELVVVHRADTDHDRTIKSEDHWRLVESVLAARRGAPESNGDFRALQSMTLSSQLPPVSMPEYRALARPVLDDYLGDYQLPRDAGNFAGRKLTSAGTVRVFLFDEKPYIHLPGKNLDFVHSVHKTGVMSTAYVSGRVPVRYERLVAKQARAARTSKSDLVARYVIEKSLETEFPGISFRDSLSGREAYLTGHRVAVWEVLVAYEETKSVDKTADHFRWPRALVKRALAYAKAFPDEVSRSREGETDTAAVAG